MANREQGRDPYFGQPVEHFLIPGASPEVNLCETRIERLEETSGRAREQGLGRLSTALTALAITTPITIYSGIEASRTLFTQEPKPIPWLVTAFMGLATAVEISYLTSGIKKLMISNDDLAEANAIRSALVLHGLMLNTSNPSDLRK
jgi:hypothetical protein